MTIKDPIPALSFDSVLVTALVERPHTRASLAIKHILSPHHSLSDPIISNARDALLSAPHLVFPPDLPEPLEDDDEQDDDDENVVDLEPRSVPASLLPTRSALFSTHDEHHMSASVHGDVSAPPPLKLTRARPPFPISPISDSPPASPRQGAEAQLNRAVDLARTLPLSCAGVYNALAEPATESRMTLRQPTTLRQARGRAQAVLQVSGDAMRPRRANSLPRRPSSSPPSRARSLGLPMYGREQSALEADERRYHSSHVQRAPELRELSSLRGRRNFRHVLLNAKTHTFAVTAKDGSRQYVYCRPLSHMHSMVVMTNVTHTGYYVSALERIAARYALLVDEIVELKPVSNGDGEIMLQTAKERWENFLRFELLRCPPQVAKELTRSLLEWLRTGRSSGRIDFANDGLLRRTRSRIFRDNPEFAEDEAFRTDDEGHSITWISSSATSSNRSSRAREENPAYTAKTDDSVAPHRESDWFGWRKIRGNEGGESGSSTSDLNTPLPWEAAAADAAQVCVSKMKRVLELTDATILFRHFSVRSLMSVIVAVLEERRVCIVGPNTAQVTRAVLALDNLLRPFEWPHTLSPVLLEHMLPVLGAPFPFIVGILCEQVEQTKELPLDEVVFANLATGKVTATTDVGDFHKHIPRRIRHRFEKRLTRIRNACLRQVSRSLASPYVPTVSNTATSYFDCETYDVATDGKVRPLLFRSKSQLRLINAANPQNIWLEHRTVVDLDKTMRKFYADLLDDLPTIRKDSHFGIDPPPSEKLHEKVSQFSTASVAGFTLATTTPETDRRQLLRAFTETQMFMQWEQSEGADIAFGVTKSEASRLRIRNAHRVQFGTAKDNPYCSDEERVSTFDSTGMSDHEFAEDIVMDFEEFVEEKPIAKRFRRKTKVRNQARLQFNSDIEDDVTDPRGMLSEMEGQGYRGAEYRPMKLRPRNLSTECVADVESESLSKRTWLTLKLPTNRRAGSRETAATTFTRKRVYGPEDAFDQLEADYTEAEDSDDLSNNGNSDMPKTLDALDGNAFNKGKVRAWRRRAKHAIRT